MFATLPDFTPRDSHSLWYVSPRAPILGGLPEGPRGTGANDDSNGAHHGSNQHNQHPSRQRGQVLERTALARLAADEAHMQRCRVNIQNFGNTWLKPPGIPKTLHQMREEKREQEEHQEAMRREQLAQELAEAEAEAAGMVEEDAMDDVQLDGVQDLDEEIPDADDEFALGNGSSESEDNDSEEEEEEAEEDDVEERLDASTVQEAMREERRRNDLMAARMRMTDDAFREALVRGDPDGDDMYGGEEELDERSQGHVLSEEDFAQSSGMAGGGAVMHDDDLGMDADLDDDIPEAGSDGGYEHTDSDAALSSDDRRDSSDDEDVGFAARVAPLVSPPSPTLRGQQRHRHRRSAGAASAGPQSSMDLSAFLSQDESSFMDSSPVQARRNMRG